MGGIRFCVCGCQSENPFVCFSAKPTQRACARDLPRDQKDEGSEVREKTEESSQQKGAAEIIRDERPVKRRKQLTKEIRRRQPGDENRAEKREEQKSERRLLRLVDLQRPSWPTREVKSTLLVVLWEFSLEYTLALAHRNTECTKSVT